MASIVTMQRTHIVISQGIAGVSGDARLLVLLQSNAVREEACPMLHHYAPGLEAAGDEGQVAHGGGNPFLPYVVPHSGLSHGDFPKQRVMVESQDNI